MKINYTGVIMKLNLLSDNNSSKHQVFKFKTNARVFKINFNVENRISGYFPHVGISAREGLMLLYKSVNGKSWFNIDAYTTRYNTNVNMTHIINEGEEYEVLIYGPILSDLSMLEIELPENTRGEVVNIDNDLKILIAGGMYSYGMGCTTTGLLFSNILGRKTNAKVDNISFFEKDFLKRTYEHLKNKENLPEYNLGILEVDNYIQDKTLLDEYLLETLKVMKTFCNRIICWYSISNYTTKQKKHLEKLLEKEISSGNIELLDISYLFNAENKDLCTFSDKFINDTGNIMIYKHMEELVVDIMMEEILGSF